MVSFPTHTVVPFVGLAVVTVWARTPSLSVVVRILPSPLFSIIIYFVWMLMLLLTYPWLFFILRLIFFKSMTYVFHVLFRTHTCGGPFNAHCVGPLPKHTEGRPGGGGFGGGRVAPSPTLLLASKHRSAALPTQHTHQHQHTLH